MPCRVRTVQARERRVRFVLASALLASPAAAQLTDDFVLAGQSNQAGASTQYENTKVGRVTSPNAAGLASWTFRLADHRWQLANEFPCDDGQCHGTNCAYPGANRTVEVHPVLTDVGNGTCVCDCGVHFPAKNEGGDAGRGSPWPTFAARWMSERGRAVRFVATSIGGQCLVAAPTAKQPAWDPDAMDCSTLVPTPIGVAPQSTTQPGELYCRMLEAVALAGVGDLRAVLWNQGECDAPYVTRVEYEDGLERLADAIWRDLGVPLVVAPVSLRTRTDDACESPAWDAEIAAATEDAARTHAHIQLGPSLDDLVFEPGCLHVHDVVTLGDRWFAAAAAAVTACNDGADNDGDGAVDHRDDPGCYSERALREDPECQNGLDDDGDGRVDFDGGAAAGLSPPTAPDTQCARAEGREQSAASCGLGAEIAVVAAALSRGRRAARVH
jgi:hypothetical protein